MSYSSYWTLAWALVFALQSPWVRAHDCNDAIQYEPFDPTQFSLVDLSGGARYPNYVVLHRKNRNISVTFGVKDGVLKFAIQVKGAGKEFDDGPRIRGFELFDYMMKILAEKNVAVNMIESVWLNDEFWDTNFNEFTRLYFSEKKTKEKAALGTWTGRQVQRYGFKNVKVSYLSGEEIRAEFTRDPSDQPH